MKLAITLVATSLLAVILYFWRGPDQVGEVHNVDWEVYGQDLGSTLREVRWQAPPGAKAPQKMVSTQRLSFLAQASYQEDNEGFVFRPSDRAAPLRLRTEAEGKLGVRYVFDWCGRGKPPSEAKVWVVAGCHGSRSVPTVSSVRLTDAVTGLAPRSDPESELQKRPPNGPVSQRVLLKVKDGRAEIVIRGTVKTGGTGKWSVIIGGSATPSPSYRMGQGPIPPRAAI